MRLRKEIRVLDYLEFKTNIFTTVNGQKISADFKISFNCMTKGASNNTFRLLRHWPDVNLTDDCTDGVELLMQPIRTISKYETSIT